jgi:hypothetical protein
MKLRDMNDAERSAGMKESTVTEQPEVRDFVKVYLPGESPWAECVTVHDDGTWDGRIDNYLCCTSEHCFSVHQITRFVPSPESPRCPWIPAACLHGGQRVPRGHAVGRARKPKGRR